MKKLLLAFLLMPALSFAAALPTDPQAEAFEDFSGGLNTQRNQNKVRKDQTPCAANGLIDQKPGSIVKRNGMTLIASTNTLSKVNFMKEFVNDDGSKGFFVSDSSTVLYTTDLQSWTLVKSSLTSTARLRAVQGRGFMLFTNGVDSVFISSGMAGIPLDGLNLRPNVPRGKYPAFYQERFFLFNTTANPSALQWMEQSSTDGYVIPIVDPNAWPITNQLYVGESDGAAGSGMDVFAGYLRFHKHNKAIYTLFGLDESDYKAQPTNTNTGTASFESIVQLDDREHYFEQEGVKTFIPSGDSQRISDDILPDMQIVVSNLANVQSDIWDTQNEFNTKGLVAGTTVISEGSLLIFSTQAANDIPIVGGEQNSPTFAAGEDYRFDFNAGGLNSIPVIGSTSTPWVKLSSQVIATNNLYSGYLERIGLDIDGSEDVSCVNGTGQLDVIVYARNLRTGLVTKGNYHIANMSARTEDGYPIIFNATFPVTVNDILSSSVEIKVEFGTSAWAQGSGSGVCISSLAAKGLGVFVLSNTTGSYLSQITTITRITSWSTFDSVFTKNSGNISYYVKAATSIVQLSTEPFMPISAGNNIPYASSRTYVQWMATMSATSIQISTNMLIANVVLNHNEGGQPDSSPFGIEWQKRYWLLVSTNTDGTVSTVYVKSRVTNSNPNAWMKFTFANDYFKSMAKFNDNLYFGSGSAGKIYRSDFGTNDNGSAINWYYDTPELELGNKYFEKKQNKYYFDLDKQTNGNLSFGTAVNGSSFTYRTVNIDGTGRTLKLLNHNSTSSGIPTDGLYFKYRFANSELDKPMTFNGFGLIYSNTGISVNP